MYIDTVFGWRFMSAGRYHDNWINAGFENKIVNIKIQYRWLLLNESEYIAKSLFFIFI